MNDPSISPKEIPKTDHPDPPTNQSHSETPRQLIATPSNTSISSDHESSGIMIASMTSHDEPKTDVSDFGVESLVGSTVTIALDSSSGSEGNASIHSVVIEGSMVETRGDSKDDAGSETSVEVVDDVEESTTCAAIYGDSNVGDEKDDEDDEEEKPIQTAKSVLGLSTGPSPAVPERRTFNYEAPFPTSYERGPHNEVHSAPGTPPGLSDVDMRPYPPVPPGGFTMHSPSTILPPGQYVMHTPKVPVPPSEFAMHSPSARDMIDPTQVTTLLPDESDDDNDNDDDGVETLSRADFHEVDPQESAARRLMREMEAAHPSIPAGSFLQSLNTETGTLNLQFIGDKDRGMPADFLQRFTQGHSMPHEHQTEAERRAVLDARHKARVASDAVEAQSRNINLREKLKKVREGTVPSPEGSDAAPAAAGTKALKVPPKPKSKGARIMALRAAKSAAKSSRAEVQGEFCRSDILVPNLTLCRSSYPKTFCGCRSRSFDKLGSCQGQGFDFRQDPCSFGRRSYALQPADANDLE